MLYQHGQCFKNEYFDSFLKHERLCQHPKTDNNQRKHYPQVNRAKEFFPYSMFVH